MNIQILDSWLREHLTTKASAKDIAKYLSLCGPSVERLEKRGKDYVYDIEITTNRVDMMSVRGIAREIAVILPQFGIKANLKPLKLISLKPIKKSLPLNIKINNKLSQRVMGVVISDIGNWKTPDWMKDRLEASGIRSLGAPIDITNYVMIELGHPTHIFDYDLIKTHKMIIRESKKGESIISLDNKKYTLPGGDIVIDDGTGKIIDLPGIIGTKNSVINEKSKHGLFFLETNDPVKIRRTSMTLGIRTVAATINEKGVDPELGTLTMLRGLELYEKICGAKVASKIYDLYPIKIKPKAVITNISFIENYLGININKIQVSKILTMLGFKINWSGDKLTVIPPSFRSQDITIPVDIVEEVARIYGYHNLPSKLMAGELTEPNFNTNFKFERKIKSILKGYGATEIYSLSLVEKNKSGNNALSLKNPLGADTAYLRTTLKYSLLDAINNNKQEDKPFHIFEMANIYLNNKNNLPEEKMMLAGILSDYKYRNAKGVIESLLEELNISNININLKVLNKNNIYYEFEVEELYKNSNKITKYKPLPKFPAQIEDITFELPQQTYIGDVINLISKTDLITEVKLNNIYKNNYTFRVWYTHPNKTLSNNEVEKARNKMILNINSSLGGKVK